MPERCAITQDPLQEWLAARRSALVEIRNHDGRTLMVSRASFHCGPNSDLQLSPAKTYDHALQYFMKFFYPDRTWQGIVQLWPNIRLQVWYSRWGQNLGDVYERNVGIDVEAWDVVWEYADRIQVVL